MRVFYILLILVLIIVSFALVSRAQEPPPLVFDPSTVTVKWDANNPAPEGYRVFKRELPADFDRSAPVYEGPATQAQITGLEINKTYGFIVIAYEGSMISADSDQVIWTPSEPSKTIVYQPKVQGIAAQRVTVNVTIE